MQHSPSCVMMTSLCTFTLNISLSSASCLFQKMSIVGKIFLVTLGISLDRSIQTNNSFPWFSFYLLSTPTRRKISLIFVIFISFLLSQFCSSMTTRALPGAPEINGRSNCWILMYNVAQMLLLNTASIINWQCYYYRKMIPQGHCSCR